MLDHFRKFISEKNLFQASDKILLAVSGGIDSVAMCELFHEASLEFGIAHCNFQLRGEASLQDELFVRSLAEQYEVPYYTRRFETSSFASDRGISIQMVARELRYQWFESIRISEGYLWIATAHHLDDQVETFFLNLMRNSGLAGFHGIPVKQGNIIRPLMFSRRKDISKFVKKNHLRYREDSSNKDTKYLRNKIRHSVLPILSETYKGFDTIINETIERIADVEKIYREAIETQRDRIITQKENRTYLDIAGIQKLDPAHTYLFEFLYPFGFSFVVVKEIFQALDKTPGKIFYSPTHKLVKDREYLILEPLSENLQPRDFVKTISEEVRSITEPLHLTFCKTEKNPDWKIDPSREIACIDADKVKYPLVLRKWQQGDLFYPFGMNGKKKVSDFLINEKLSLPDKEDVWVLMSDEKIFWLIGFRIDNRFRITTKTREVLVITSEKEK